GSEAVGDLIQDLGAVGLAHPRPRPLVERAPRGGDRALRVLPARARDASPRLLGGGVDRVGGLPAFGVTKLAVDVDLIVGHGCLLPRRGGARHGGRGSRLLGASPSGGQRDPAPEKDGGRRRRRPPSFETRETRASTGSWWVSRCRPPSSSRR